MGRPRKPEYDDDGQRREYFSFYSLENGVKPSLFVGESVIDIEPEDDGFYIVIGKDEP